MPAQRAHGGAPLSQPPPVQPTSSTRDVSSENEVRVQQFAAFIHAQQLRIAELEAARKAAGRPGHQDPNMNPALHEALQLHQRQQQTLPTPPRPLLSRPASGSVLAVNQRPSAVSLLALPPAAVPQTAAPAAAPPQLGPTPAAAPEGPLFSAIGLLGKDNTRRSSAVSLLQAPMAESRRPSLGPSMLRAGSQLSVQSHTACARALSVICGGESGLQLGVDTHTRSASPCGSTSAGGSPMLHPVAASRTHTQPAQLNTPQIDVTEAMHFGASASAPLSSVRTTGSLLVNSSGLRNAQWGPAPPPDQEQQQQQPQPPKSPPADISRMSTAEMSGDLRSRQETLPQEVLCVDCSQRDDSSRESSSPDGLTVVVQLPAGADGGTSGSIAVQVEPGDTVAELKKSLEVLTGTATTKQRLYCGSRQLRPGEFMASVCDAAAGIPLVLAVSPRSDRVGRSHHAAATNAPLVTLLTTEGETTPKASHRGGVTNSAAGRGKGEWPFKWRPSTMTIGTATTEGLTSECRSDGGSEPPRGDSFDTPLGQPLQTRQPLQSVRSEPGPAKLPGASASAFARLPTASSHGSSSDATDTAHPALEQARTRSNRGVVIGAAEAFPATPLSDARGGRAELSAQTLPNCKDMVPAAPVHSQSPPLAPALSGTLAGRRGNQPPPPISTSARSTPRASQVGAKQKSHYSPSAGRRDGASTRSVDASQLQDDDYTDDEEELWAAAAAEAWGTDSEGGGRPGSPLDQALAAQNGSLVSAWASGARCQQRDWPGGGRQKGDLFAVAWRTLPGSREEKPVCCCAVAGRPTVRVYPILGGRELPSITFASGARSLCADGSRVVVGGDGQLHCYDLQSAGDQCLWKAQTDCWETLAVGGGRLVCGAKQGSLFLQRTREHPDEARRIELRGSAQAPAAWQSVVVDPPYIVAVDANSGLYVWTTSPPGVLVGHRLFGASAKPHPGLPRGAVRKVALRGGVIATLHVPPNGQGSSIHLWDAATGHFLMSRQQYHIGEGVAVQLAGQQPNLVVAVADQTSLRLFHLRDKAEVKGDWTVPAGVGGGEQIFFAGRTAMLAVHEKGVIEWTPQGLAKGSPGECSIM
eukprot:TRINITY_DN399_c2_g1_i1.p1 TRINITY_DN399_c2_g1~~TRINITY_DN399_c2_g1_i1.p1  ORF type:complete len:1093 (+),score=171.44 TRINITY_DN399_c2_g1_i1:113-3391(+)